MTDLADRLTSQGARPVDRPTPVTGSEVVVGLSDHQAIAALMTTASPVGLLAVDENWACSFANDAAAALVGRRADDLAGIPWFHYAQDKDVGRLKGALEAVSRSGEPVVIAHDIADFYAEDRAVELAIAPMSDRSDGKRHFVVSVQDVSHRRRIERDLAAKAANDPLTGLPNRATVLQHIRRALDLRNPGEVISVAFIDLDGFKPVNELLGHEAGDELLVAVARRLRQATHPGEMVGRIGGDEFVACAGPGPADPDGLGHRILRSLRDPVSLRQGGEANVGASIGLASTDDGDRIDVEQLIRDADTAMYQAKRQGGGRFAHFRPSSSVTGTSSIQLEADLRRAFASGELQLYYQPIMDTTSSRIVCAEGLIRWNHPTNGVMYPDEFLPIVTKIGVQRELTEFVVGEAAAQGASWTRALGEAAPAIAINISAADLADRQLAALVGDALDSAGLRAGGLRVEVNEAALARDPNNVVELLGELHLRGIPVSIDDFGRGQSILSCLPRMAVETVKIDKCFIAQLASGALDTAARSRTILAAMIDLAHGLGMTVVAEGVETSDAFTVLASLGCDMTQGYLHAAPLTAPELDLSSILGPSGQRMRWWPRLDRDRTGRGRPAR